jgi:class 3 adenylate cyclase/tetratricopeptide (TPR) repeat protein
MDAERRLVTVLYADLAGHTEVATRLDAEEWRAILDAYFSEMARPIARYGGTVEKFIGDAIFAVFGVPRAHEDDAERAVRAALEMQDTLTRMRPGLLRRLGSPLEMRIGIATGEAVAPSDAREDRLVTGELTTLAERLQRHAPANGVILSERSFRILTSVVDAEPLGALVLKGFAVPQRGFVVRRVAPVMERARGLGVAAPLIGRERELADLERARGRLLGGQGQIVAVIGEAGLGKSRLVAELQARLGAEATVLAARCQEFTQGVSFGAVAQHLRASLRLEEGDPPEVVRLQVGAALTRTFGAGDPEMRAAVERLLGLAASALPPAEPGLAGGEVRPELAGAMRRFWEGVATEAPVVLAVEDMHWIDAASAAVIGELLAVTERAPLMLVCVFRPERRSLAWDLKVAAERDYPHRYLEVRLEPLSRAETERLAAALLASEGLPENRKVGVAHRAEGNPLYVEELVRSLHLDDATADVDLLPDTLHGLLQARLDALPRPTRRVAQAAAVIGRTFPEGLLKAAGGFDGDLGTHLSLLQRAGFVFEEERRPEPRFAFKHVLLRDAAYGTMLREERREAHRRLAEALEREPGAGHTPALLAFHYLQAEHWEKAFEYSAGAADAAYALSALEDALGHVEVGLRIAREHPGRIRDQRQVLRCQQARGELLSYLGRYEEAERHYQDLLGQHPSPGVRARTLRGLAHLHGYRGNLRDAQANLEEAVQLLQTAPDPAEEAQVAIRLARVLENRREYARALDSGDRARTLAEGHDLDLEVREEIHRILAGIHFYGGEAAQALTHAEAALSVAVQMSVPLSIVRDRNNLAALLLFFGRIHDARAEAEEALAVATRLESGVAQLVVQSTLANILTVQGRTGEAAAILSSSEEVLRRHTLSERYQAVVHLERGFLALAEGQWEEAIRQLEAAKSLNERGGLARPLPRVHRGLAEAHLGRGALAEARTHAQDVLTLEREGNPVETPGALRVLATIARRDGDVAGALSRLEEAVGLMSTRQGSGEYAAVLLELAHTYGRAGRRAEARQAAEVSLRIYHALEAAPYAEAARAAVAGL